MSICSPGSRIYLEQVHPSYPLACPLKHATFRLTQHSPTNYNPAGGTQSSRRHGMVRSPFPERHALVMHPFCCYLLMKRLHYIRFQERQLTGCRPRLRSHMQTQSLWSVMTKHGSRVPFAKGSISSSQGKLPLSRTQTPRPHIWHWV